MPVDLVVIGLGYVGLPLAQAAAHAGVRVAGYDVDQRKVDILNSGRSYIDDLTDTDVAALRSLGFHATSDESVLAHADTAAICVPTPLTPDGGPDLTAVVSAAETVARHLRPGMLVVLESTTYPGTTDEMIRPVLEASGLHAGTDFHLAFSPERIDPGNHDFGLANTPKVVGGHTETCADAAEAFYGKFIEKVVRAKGTREAEMAKLLENTYRHVNIALVNEMAVFCHDLGIDIWNVIECASTKPFGFEPFYPGPGVGGHCIPIDPNYLSFKVRTLGYPFRFVELAQEINARMPNYVVQRGQELLNQQAKPVRGSYVLLVGLTYKPDISDERESPALPIGRRLLAMGAHIEYLDPFVTSWTVDGLRIPRAETLSRIEAADLTILLQHHTSLPLEEISQRARLLLDARGLVTGPHVERL